ncbi:MAG: phosphomannomutase/phosphoglucomutase [Clostridia bacterium]|nr:phosphomannomutase/phosphoglucomutase [Clostridia bacterium]
MKNYKALQNGSDIRGVAMAGIEGQAVSLTKEIAADIALGFAFWLAQKTGKNLSELVLSIGMDSRISGPALLTEIGEVLSLQGVKVLNCGMATTPAMFMSTVFEEISADGAMMITASHLPFNRNGIKFFCKDGGLDAKDVTAILGNAQDEDLIVCTDERVHPFKIEYIPLISLYSRHLREMIVEGLKDFMLEKPLEGLHVVCDAGNGAGGFYVYEVLEPLGATVAGSQFLEPDGYFPNHEPNPENKKALKAISSAVCSAHADLGLIFDTDVDRCAAVDSFGNEISRNKIVAIAAALVAENSLGSTIVTDSITSDQLTDFIQGELGLLHMRYMRGYRNVISKAVELNKEGIDCQLAIETSGHAAFKENYFLDDGAYLATKIVIRAAQLKHKDMTIESMIKTLKEPKEAKEYRIPVNTENFNDYADGVISELSDLIARGECTSKSPCEGRCRCGMELVLPNYEGVRVSCDEQNGDGWFLLRKSLHEPLLPLNAESNVEGGCKIIIEKVKKLLEMHTKLDLSVLNEE